MKRFIDEKIRDQEFFEAPINKIICTFVEIVKILANAD